MQSLSDLKISTDLCYSLFAEIKMEDNRYDLTENQMKTCNMKQKGETSNQLE